MKAVNINVISVFANWNPRVVSIGNVKLGGNYPVRIQSMTNTPTLDTQATVAQCIRMIEAGCEMVRITTQNRKEAENLKQIKKMLREAGFATPLIADVHFSPAVAEIAARIVEKVRINPGNYADKQKPGFSWTSGAYEAELEHIAIRLLPLLNICREHGTAIRIGTNHGSLSGRIMYRYGDTPLGMAESAMEFVRICHHEGFHNLVLSMKSSNVRVMVEATRLLVHKMIAENMMQPVHLGVTEAGNGLEGRIKSSSGIGALLADGIGDTIRVSLTEAPENEIPVARQIAGIYPKPVNRITSSETGGIIRTNPDFSYKRRISMQVGPIGNGNLPIVLWGAEKLYAINEYGADEGAHGLLININTANQRIEDVKYLFIDVSTDPTLPDDLNGGDMVLVLKIKDAESVMAGRKMIAELVAKQISLPVILAYEQSDPDAASFAVSASALLAPILNDGLCDGIWLKNPELTQKQILNVAFDILQATRARITKTEFIACPGCGRTQYNLEESFEKVKQATSHLKGLKIAVMGCIVNGPGEMADADYGYVGQGNGKVALYRGKTLVKRDIPEEKAVDELIVLMQSQGHWQYP